MTIYRLGEHTPNVPVSAYVAPQALIIGRVTLGDRVSVWPCAVLRADDDTIGIGDNTNIQDGAVLHVDPGRPMVDPRNVFQIGIRSVDDIERQLIARHGVNVFDMRTIDELGIAAIMRQVIETVSAANGLLHVSLDVDFLDPDIAPGVGTTVPGGATFREAHLIMEMLHDCGIVASLDLVELNPFLDDRGKIARIMVELTASLFGRRVLDRPTRSA